MSPFLSILISVLMAFGMSVALVEKGKEFPIKSYNIILRMILHDYIYWKAQFVLYCTTCTSFWMALVADSLMWVSGFGYFFWPMSGFITLGFTWFIIELLNVLDKNPVIKNYNYNINSTEEASKTEEN